MNKKQCKICNQFINPTLNFFNIKEGVFRHSVQHTSQIVYSGVLRGYQITDAPLAYCFWNDDFLTLSKPLKVER